MRVSTATLILSGLASTCLAKPIALERRTTTHHNASTVSISGSHYHSHSGHLHTQSHATGTSHPSGPFRNVTTVHATRTVSTEVQCSGTYTGSDSGEAPTSTPPYPTVGPPPHSNSTHSTGLHSGSSTVSRSSSAAYSSTVLPSSKYPTSSPPSPSSSAAHSSTVLPSSESASSSASSPSSTSISSQYQQGVVSAIGVITDTWDDKGKAWKQMGGWVGAVVFKTLMDYDHWTGSKSQESIYGAALLDIVTNKDLLNSSGAIDGFNDDQAWWVLAFLRAYQNYGHVELLNQAATQWKQIQASSQTTASNAGTAPKLDGLQRNQVIPASCNVAGAVYWEQTPGSPITAISTSLFAQMGAELYAFTKDEQYRQGADAAINWLRSMMLSDTGIMNVDHVNIAGCAKGAGSLTYNTGNYSPSMTRLRIYRTKPIFRSLPICHYFPLPKHW